MGASYLRTEFGSCSKTYLTHYEESRHVGDRVGAVTEEQEGHVRAQGKGQSLCICEGTTDTAAGEQGLEG